jgi:hypothetical protein
LTALVEIAELAFPPDQSVGTNVLRTRLEVTGLTGVAAALALKMLGRRDFVEFSIESSEYGNEYSVVRITEGGWAWLEANRDKLKLVVDVPPMAAKPRPEKVLNEDDIPF